MKTKQKMSPLNPTANLITIGAVIIIGAIFRWSHPQAGHWITVIALAWYLVTNLPGAIRLMKYFSALPVRKKGHLAIVGVMSVIFLWSVFATSALNYFLVLLLLSVEYLLLEETNAADDPDRQA